MIYEQIAGNKRKSFLLLFLFILFFLFLGWVFGEFYHSGAAGITIAFVIAIFLSFSTFFYGDKIVLGISRAKPVDPKENPYLYNVIEGLAIAAGIPKPKAYIMVILVGTVALLSDWMGRSFFYGRGRRNRRGGGNAIVILLALALAILAPLIAKLLQLAISRQKEYLADASGAMLTRYPEGLASALEKISKDTEPLEAANKATAHLYVVNPLLEYRGKLNALFSTHPPAVERINRLKKMAFIK